MPEQQKRILSRSKPFSRCKTNNLPHNTQKPARKPEKYLKTNYTALHTNTQDTKLLFLDKSTQYLHLTHFFSSKFFFAIFFFRFLIFSFFKNMGVCTIYLGVDFTLPSRTCFRVFVSILCTLFYLLSLHTEN